MNKYACYHEVDAIKAFKNGRAGELVKQAFEERGCSNVTCSFISWMPSMSSKEYVAMFAVSYQRGDDEYSKYTMASVKWGYETFRFKVELQS